MAWWNVGALEVDLGQLIYVSSLGLLDLHGLLRHLGILNTLGLFDHI